MQCKSADFVRDAEDAVAAPPEVLNALQPNGFPEHELRLKPNMPIMLLRNMSPTDGLCNGTRLLVRRVITHPRSGYKLKALSASSHVIHRPITHLRAYYTHTPPSGAAI